MSLHVQVDDRPISYHKIAFSASRCRGTNTKVDITLVSAYVPTATSVPDPTAKAGNREP